MNNQDLSRKNFLKQGIKVSLAASLFPFNSLEPKTINSIPTKKFSFPSPSTERLTTLLNIKYPIIQAPTGGVVTSDLTSAVANSGGLGATPLTWTSADQLPNKIKAVLDKTSKPFFGNYVRDSEPATLELALKSGVKIIQFSWGMPTEEECSLIKSHDGILGIQVTSKASAKKALDLGAQYLVCQGIEAGGHVQASKPLEDALKEVLSVSGEIPVVASGGISSGKTMHKYMSMGAAGVVMGSRFVATIESGAHPVYKEELVKANAEDTVFTVCNSKGWDNALHRIIRNSTFEMWEAAGLPPAGARPGEKDIVANVGDYEVERYSVSAPHLQYTGDIEAMALYAGESVSQIKDIPSVKEVIERVWKEFSKIK